MTLLTETGFLQSESGIPSLLQETRVGGHIGSTDYPQTRLERSVLSTRVWGKPVGAVREKGIYSTVHTCVGEAITYAILSRSHWYCPHVCGGSMNGVLLRVHKLVLSTRVWGKRKLKERERR